MTVPAMCSCILHNNFVQDLCRQFRPWHVDPDQPNPRPDPNPNPNANPNPLGGSKSAGAVSRVFRRRFSKKKSGGRNTRPDRKDPHPAQTRIWTEKTRTPHKALCRVKLHIARVLRGGYIIASTRAEPLYSAGCCCCCCCCCCSGITSKSKESVVTQKC